MATTPVDLFAFGNRKGPRGPRVGLDVLPDSQGFLQPDRTFTPQGASLFADPRQSGLTGHYHRLRAGSELPCGLVVTADGSDVLPESPLPPTHHTMHVSVTTPASALPESGVGIWRPPMSMSLPPLSDHEQALWESVVTAENAVRNSLRAFLVESPAERVKLVRQALHKPGSDRAAAFRVLPYLSELERMDLFPDIVQLASWAHGLTQAARNAICSLPRDWVLAQIESVAEPLLAASSDQHQFEEYRRLLELYHQLGDGGLVRRLADRAGQHSDEEVREAGQEFLENA